jgi:hypothetical protein
MVLMAKPPKLARWTRLRDRAERRSVTPLRRASTPNPPTKVIRTRQTRTP